MITIPGPHRIGGKKIGIEISSLGILLNFTPILTSKVQYYSLLVGIS